MGVFYQLSGVVNVRNCPEAGKVVEDLRNSFENESVEAEADANGVIALSIDAGDYMTYTSVGELDDLVLSLGPFVVGGPFFVKYDCDGDVGYLTVGEVPEGKSVESLEKRRLLEDVGFDDLDAEDAAAVIAAILEVRVREEAVRRSSSGGLGSA